MKGRGEPFVPRRKRLYDVATLHGPILVTVATLCTLALLILLWPDVPHEIAYQWGPGGTVRMGSLRELYGVTVVGGVVGLLCRAMSGFTRRRWELVFGMAVTTAVGYVLCASALTLLLVQIDGYVPPTVPLVLIVVACVVFAVSAAATAVAVHSSLH